MNRKTTFLSLKCLLAIAFTQMLNAQQIYTNGGLSTGATSGSGTAAPAGYTWSECQNETGNTTESNTNAGYTGIYNTAGTLNFQLADNFVVPAGQQWNVTSVDVFGYQTGSAAATNPFNALRVQIFNGDPSSGGTPVAGNLTTNIMDGANSTAALVYRIFNSTTPAPGTAAGTTRKVWRLRGTLAATLPAGTYWVVYQAHTTNDATAFFPSVTISGSRGLAGWNAKQNVVASTDVAAVLGWADVVDAGNPATAPDFPQDMPFVINGTVTLGVDENSFEASVSLSPNPTKNVLSIAAPTDTTINGYEIFDVNGKVVKALSSSSSSISEINVSELSVGNYIIKLKSDNGMATKKFIKE